MRLPLAGKRTVWADPQYDAFIVNTAKEFGWQSKEAYQAFIGRFPEKDITHKAFMNRAHQLKMEYERLQSVHIPEAATPDVNELIMQLPWKTVLITSDYQIPYHDEVLIKKAFELGAAYNVEGHVLNADFFDVAALSKFPQQIFGERVQLGEELQLGRAIIKESQKLHRQVALLTGNHEWRVLKRLLQGQLTAEQTRDFLAGNDVLYTPLSYAWLGYDEDNAVRITHPRSQSVIAGAVGADISRNHDCHVIVAHDHLIAQRRSHSGRWSVTHSGMMAKPGKLMYATTADDRRPRMNQGFVIVHPSSEGRPVIRLIDPKNCDWEAEFWLAARKTS